MSSAIYERRKGQGSRVLFPFNREEIRTSDRRVEALRARPAAKLMELMTWLKNEHGMGHGHANALVAHTLAEDKKLLIP